RPDRAPPGPRGGPPPAFCPAGPTAGSSTLQAARARMRAESGPGAPAAAMLARPMRFGLYVSAEVAPPGAPAARVPAALPEVYASLLEDARVAEAAVLHGVYVSAHH